MYTPSNSFHDMPWSECYRQKSQDFFVSASGINWVNIICSLSQLLDE